ncbi:MAG TPA: hypothetical protein VN132_03655 [Bdellovibrio sp.]|nr:hypothetical protein [Bdellovibrio sp.]
MKKNILFSVVAFFASSSIAFASDSNVLNCNLLNGNVSGDAKVTINKLDGSTLTISDGTASLQESFDHRREFSPDGGPYNSLGLNVQAKQFRASEDRGEMFFKEHFINCGRSASTDCNIYLTYDTQTKQVRVTAKVGIIFVYTEVDYSMQCQ